MPFLNLSIHVYTHQTHEHSPKFPCYPTHIATYSTCTCTCIYMQLVIVQWNFFEFNVLEGYSALYGAYSWHWWVSRLLTVFIAGSKLVNGIAVGWFECTLSTIYNVMYMCVYMPLCTYTCWCLGAWMCVCFNMTRAWHFRVLSVSCSCCLLNN